MRKLISMVVLVAVFLLAPTLAFGQMGSVPDTTAPGGKPGVTTYLPQFVAGGDWGYRTVLRMKNLASIRSQIRVDWRDSQGENVTLVSSLGGPSWGFVTNLPEGDFIWENLLSSPGGLQTGCMTFVQPVTSEGKLETSVSVVFLQTGGNGATVPVTLELPPVEATRRVAFYGSKDSTGLAICNPADAPVTVTLTRVNRTPVSVTLPSKGQIARFLGDLLGAFSGVELIEVHAPSPVAVILLEMIFDSTDGLVKYRSVPTARAQ
jgi:hypothetical protein